MSTTGPKDDQNLLWHYTSVETLEKILKGCLWFSHYSTLNDPDELNIVNSRWDDLLRMVPNTEDIRSDSLAARVENLAPAIFCCSRNRDNLLLWVSYADSLKGVAIGIRPSEISAPAMPSEYYYSGYSLEEVAMSYNEMDLTFHVYESIVHELSSALPSRGQSPGAQLFFQNAALSLALQGIRYKSPGWQQEDEVRLVVRPETDVIGRSSPDMSGRWRCNGQRRYIEVPFDPQASIAAVQSGPHCEEATVQAILDSHELGHIRVEKSKTHVRRDWPTTPEHKLPRLAADGHDG